MDTHIIERIVDAVGERRDPFAAGRVAFTIVEQIEPGNVVGGGTGVAAPPTAPLGDRHERANAKRYYLHQVQTNEVVPDPEGGEYPDLSSAEREAVDAAREMMATAVRAGRDISDWVIEIADERGDRVSRVPFASVVTREPKRVR